MKIFNIALLALTVAALTSCGKDFLETEPAGSSYSSEQLKQMSKIDPNIAKSQLDGIYVLMTKQEAGGIRGSHIDFGQKANDIVSDFLCGDMSNPVSTYGHYTSIQNYTDTSDPEKLLNYMFWRYYYKVVFAANPIIEQLGGADADIKKESDLDRQKAAVLGQALALRAYAYYYLLQYFAPSYEPESESVCLYTDVKQADLPLSKQKDVYDRIVKDLTKAVSLLDGFDRGDRKEAINANVAKGLLAYTYAAMGNYEKVKELTSEIINSHEFRMMSAEEIVYNPKTGKGSGFNSVKIPGWMWGIDIESSFDLGLVSFWGQMDIFTYSYPAVGDVAVMSDALYAKIKPGDVRRNQFGTYDGQQYVPYNKFYYSDRTVMKQRIITSDYVYMRVAEMYMLKIEAEYFLHDEAAAKKDLKEFLLQRMPNADYVDNLSGEALKTEIHNQWRIEFWGEGKAYQAMKRFKEDIHTGSNRLDETNRNVTIKWNNPKLSIKIPFNEVINNPNINIVQ